MESLLQSLETLAPIAALRFSRWAYAVVNTGHVFAIALLVGGTVPLSLRLFGFWPDVARAGVARILALTSGTGLVLALATGSLLFATRASEYAANPAFQIKLVLVTAGVVSVIAANRRHGLAQEGTSPSAARRAAVLSLIFWIGALVCGRLIAFVQG